MALGTDAARHIHFVVFMEAEDLARCQQGPVVVDCFDAALRIHDFLFLDSEQLVLYACTAAATAAFGAHD